MLNMLYIFLCSLDSIHTSAAVAFSISVFCQLINHLSAILEQYARVQPTNTTLVVPVPPSPPLPSDGDQDHVSHVSDVPSSRNEKNDDEEKESSDNDITDQNGFIVPKRRRRVRRAREDSNSESEMSDYETPEFRCSDEEELEVSGESDENWSDEEIEYEESVADEETDDVSHQGESEYNFKLETGNKAFDSSSSNGHSETSGCEGRRGRKGLTNGGGKSMADCGPSALLANGLVKQKFIIDPEDLLKFRARIEGTLVALSPFLRWIQTSSVIKDALAANAEKAFLEKFCSVLNLLLSQNWPSVLDEISVDELKMDWKVLCEGQITEKDIFKVELDEDRSMLGIPQLQDYVNKLQLKPVAAGDAVRNANAIQIYISTRTLESRNTIIM